MNRRVCKSLMPAFEGDEPGEQLEFLHALLHDDELGLRTEPEWAGDPDSLPEPSREALEENVQLSKRYAGVTGSAVNPATGNEQPRKNLLMMAATERQETD